MAIAAALCALDSFVGLQFDALLHLLQACTRTSSASRASLSAVGKRNLMCGSQSLKSTWQTPLQVRLDKQSRPPCPCPDLQLRRDVAGSIGVLNTAGNVAMLALALY